MDKEITKSLSKPFFVFSSIKGKKYNLVLRMEYHPICKLHTMKLLHVLAIIIIISSRKRKLWVWNMYKKKLLYQKYAKKKIQIELSQKFCMCLKCMVFQNMVTKSVCLSMIYISLVSSPTFMFDGTKSSDGYKSFQNNLNAL